MTGRLQVWIGIECSVGLLFPLFLPYVLYLSFKWTIKLGPKPMTWWCWLVKLYQHHLPLFLFVSRKQKPPIHESVTIESYQAKLLLKFQAVNCDAKIDVKSNGEIVFHGIEDQVFEAKRQVLAFKQEVCDVGIFLGLEAAHLNYHFPYWSVLLNKSLWGI